MRRRPCQVGLTERLDAMVVGDTPHDAWAP